MCFKSLALGGLLAVTLLPSTALADPMKTSNCGVEIKEPKNSNDYFMSKDCKTAYVLPPVKGNLTVNGYSPTIPQATCDAIQSLEERNANLQDFENSLSKSIARKGRKIAKLEQLIEEGDIPAGTTEDDILEEIDELIIQIADFNKKLADNFKEYVSRKGVYAQMEGGIGNFSLTSGYSDLIAEFQKLNQGKNVVLKKMPLKYGTMSIVDRKFDQKSNQVEMKAVKRLLMAAGPGQWKKIPLNNTADVAIDPNTAADTTGVQTALFGGGVSGQIETSALGDCAIRRNQNDGDDNPLNAITATSYWEYDLIVNRRYYVSYNFKELVHIIRESSKRGGFFNRKTVNKLIDKRRTTSWIKFYDASNDSEYSYTDDEVKEIKKEFLDRALKQIIDIRTGGKATALALLDPSGQNGAQALGNELQKCPHLYCQIGAAGLRVLNSIFGSETATSELYKRLTGESYEEQTSERAVRFYGTSAF